MTSFSEPSFRNRNSTATLGIAEPMEAWNAAAVTYGVELPLTAAGNLQRASPT